MRRILLPLALLAAVALTGCKGTSSAGTDDWNVKALEKAPGLLVVNIDYEGAGDTLSLQAIDGKRTKLWRGPKKRTLTILGCDEDTGRIALVASEFFTPAMQKKGTLPKQELIVLSEDGVRRHAAPAEAARLTSAVFVGEDVVVSTANANTLGTVIDIGMRTFPFRVTKAGKYEKLALSGGGFKDFRVQRVVRFGGDGELMLLLRNPATQLDDFRLAPAKLEGDKLVVGKPVFKRANNDPPWDELHTVAPSAREDSVYIERSQPATVVGRVDLEELRFTESGVDRSTLTTSMRAGVDLASAGGPGPDGGALTAVMMEEDAEDPEGSTTLRWLLHRTDRKTGEFVPTNFETATRHTPVEGLRADSWLWIEKFGD